MDGDQKAPIPQDSGSAIVGAVFLVIGVALLLDRMGIVPWTSQWSVWPLLLIAYGVVHLFTSTARGSKGVFPIALGVWIWTVQAGKISLDNSWPLMIIVLGLAIMWQTWTASGDRAPIAPRRRHRNPLVAFAIVALIISATAIDGNRFAQRSDRAQPPQQIGDTVDVFAMMGHTQRTASTERPFKGGEASAVMGQTELDLRNAVVPDGQTVTLDVLAMMGQVVLRVPDAWTVDNRIVPVIGEVADRRGMPDPLPRRRVRGRVDDQWLTTQGAPGAPGAPGGGGGGAAGGSGAPAAGAGGATGAAPRLVLTGSVLMGNVQIRS